MFLGFSSFNIEHSTFTIQHFAFDFRSSVPASDTIRALSRRVPVRFRLLPREETFYADFIAMADQLKVGAKLLEEMFATDPPIADKAHEIKEVEHKCDFLTHEIIQRLNKTFVTPIDREDIHSLAR